MTATTTAATGDIEFKKIKSISELDLDPKVLISDEDGSAKTLYPIYLEDKILHLVLKKPKRIVVGAFSSEPLANETIEYFEKEYGKKEFYKRKLKMNKPYGVYQD